MSKTPPRLISRGHNIKYINVLTLLLVLGVAACSSDEDPMGPPPNGNPTVTFTWGKIAAPAAGDETMTVDADDPDGDPISVMWSAKRGSFSSAPTLRRPKCSRRRQA